MAVYQRSETLYHWVTLRDRNNALIDPDTVTITITDPCGTELVSEDSMTSDSSGVYYYAYDIPANGVYGEWDIKVEADDSGDLSIFKDKMYLLPWDAVAQVRELSGITSKKSVSDDAIARIIWEAYKEALDEVYEEHNDITPKCNPDTGAWFDGTNTTFETPHNRLADYSGDGVVSGYGELSCATDIEGWWRDEDGDCHRVNITVNDAQCGNITITQLDGTAIPSSMEWVHLHYWTEWRTYNERLFRLAASYLAAHKCIIRFQELDKATLADLYSNREMINGHLMRMENEYQRTMRKIRKPLIGGAMKPGGN